MLRVQDLTKRFGQTLAVDRVTFEVARGEVVGFLGPNGAGKTTTIRVLTGYHPATSGSAHVDGLDVARDSLAVRARIGYLPENVPIYPDLRVVEYLRFRAALKGVPAKQRRAAVERAMHKADIVDVQRKLVGHVSRGYRQRVGLADALVANPPILILDEPTSGLDPNQRRRIKEVVRDLAVEHTVLFSSHILGEVQDVASRILVIDRGVLRADGKAADLVAQAFGRTLHVAVAGSPEALAAAVRDLPGLEPEPATAGPEGTARLTARVAAGADPALELGRRLLAAGLAVQELRISAPTLEEYFAWLTEGREQQAGSGQQGVAGSGPAVAAAPGTEVAS
ncbi:MAG: ABC transporter ATP-binding protein [Planctomycetes bacterium]|nr:ABC transporter ATP-binding protein [Planctomycetota bacterium]